MIKWFALWMITFLAFSACTRKGIYISDKLRTYITITYNEQKPKFKRVKPLFISKNQLVFCQREPIGLETNIGDTLNFWITSLNAFDISKPVSNVNIKIEVVDSFGKTTLDAIIYPSIVKTNENGTLSSPVKVIFKSNTSVLYRLMAVYEDLGTESMSFSSAIHVRKR